ncbi:MAG: type IV toxin-antitoxin system AbiEi family antitoxin domain-containing protein [Nanoarchaeota archaeon]
MDLSILNKFAYFNHKQFSAFLNINNSEVVLSRLNKNKKIEKIEKGKYTLHNDELIYATIITIPSYLSGLSALYYYGLTTQIPIKHTIITQNQKKSFKNFNFIKVNKNYFFGYNKVNYKNFDLFIANKEKLLIDLVNFQYLGVSIIDLNLLLKEKLNIKLIINYLKKINKISLIKRIGFLLEQNNIDIYNYFEKQIKKDKNYILLNTNKIETQNISKKWRIKY